MLQGLKPVVLSIVCGPTKAVPKEAVLKFAESRGIGKGCPGLHPGIFSAVPDGTIPGFYVYPGLRPGLLSAVPSGLIFVS
jgi:hypothetical protein